MLKYDFFYCKIFFLTVLCYNLNMKEIISLFKIFNRLINPPYDYNFLKSVDETDYPFFIKKLYKYNNGSNLNLKNPKTFNEKIQWLKLYDRTPIKTTLTDKILVRDWIRDKIGDAYLKPLLQVCDCFDKIDFDSLPNSFIIKTNHGCKWHYKIKDKTEFLNNKKLFKVVNNDFDDWLNKQFHLVGGLELQYKNINPRILIEPLLLDECNDVPIEYEIFCTNGVPIFFQQIQYSNPPVCCVWNKKFEIAKIRFNPKYYYVPLQVQNTLIEAIELSKTLSKDFVFVRVDWLLHKNKIFFNEMTFTPHSGYYNFSNENADAYLGSLIDIKPLMKGIKNGTV